MSAMMETDRIFYTDSGLDQGRVSALVGDALKGMDDGELFLEYSQSESFSFDDGKLKNANFDTTQGFGLRAVAGEAQGYAHANEISEAAIKRAAATVRSVRSGYDGTMAEAPAGTNRSLYTGESPLQAVSFADKIKVLNDIDRYARGCDSRVVQVMVSLASEWSAVQIVRGDGSHFADLRPLVRLSVSVMVGDKGRQEMGSYGAGGRVGYKTYLTPEFWQASVDEALRQALVNLDSVAAPAGEMPVVLGAGWPGILLHEAIGHGLEGDFNRKKTSAFSGLLGQRVAAPGVTVVDDGTIPDRRGSITVDDEGTPSSRTVLIEDGILKGYLQDRLNARLMKMPATGNGRRQSYSHAPMPRMTNTIMENGQHYAEEIIASVKRGIYAVNFGGGQVDITNGKFVFSASEAYLIEDGKVGPAIKGATLIGNGPDALTKVSMIGRDSRLDPGIGTCGKAGQSVPVGVGQPTMLMTGLTVGGTATA
ncbi:MAG: metalloprotease TldD [Candidatus Pacebacteria bacterium]|nr:metalloprotease TldD [Candidatus Paceibacterota bacterium]